MNVKLLSLHASYKCNLKCPFCYNQDKRYDLDLQKRPKEWFYGFPKVCSELGIRQIACGGGEPALDLKFIEEMVQECKRYGVKLNITTNGRTLKEGIEGVTLVSNSIDVYKQPNAEALVETMDNVKKISETNLVGINLLLSDNIVKQLSVHAKYFLSKADFLYILQPKPNTLHFDLKKLRMTLLALSALYPARLYVDDSLKLSLGMEESCGRGRDLVSIGADGSVSSCSFDKPFTYLETPEDLKTMLHEDYPMVPTKTCPFLGEGFTPLASIGESVMGRGMPC